MPSLRRPPGPKSRGIVGNFPMGAKDPLGVFTQWAREYGDIFHYRFLHHHIYFVNHPDLIKEVLVTQAPNFVKGLAVRGNRRIFGKGLVSNEGASWALQRKLIQPAFHRTRIESYAKTMAAYTQRLLEGWRDGQQCNVHDEMMRLTLEIVAMSLFSVEITSDQDRFARAFNNLMAYGTGPRLLLPEVLRRVPTQANRNYQRAIHEMDAIVYALVRQRQRNQALRGSPTPPQDLLQTLLEARYEDGAHMPLEQLRDEVMTLLLAGHETTAVSLSWTWLLLSQHPEVEQKLWHELDTVLRGRTPTIDDLPRLPYTECIVKESMRLYPPVWGLTRTTVCACEIGGYTVPAGCTVIMSQWVIHRDPRFYDEPERFLPDRWADERLKSAPRFTYFPFGGGPRICIGSSFAVVEAALVLAAIAQKFQVRVDTSRPIEPSPTITLRPKDGIQAALIRRSH